LHPLARFPRAHSMTRSLLPGPRPAQTPRLNADVGPSAAGLQRADGSPALPGGGVPVQEPATEGGPVVHRSIAGLLAPLQRLAPRSRHLTERSGAVFHLDGDRYEIPCYDFVGPASGDDPIRIGLFAAIHGDEPEGAHALVRFLEVLERKPTLAAGYRLSCYPVCNPTGFEDGTRPSRRGRDLNREFWRGSTEPEVRLLQQELEQHAFHGIVSLHTDDTSEGLYGFVGGATLTKHLIAPALEAAEAILPRNRQDRIDGFEARDGIIRDCYDGVLSAPPGTRPRPFEIILETPHRAPEFAKEQALVVALQTILAKYRELIAFAPNL
jgi:murein peptide amidase A